MIFPKTLDAKPTIIDENGNEIRDMTFQTLLSDSFGFLDMIRCTSDTEMRPDLLAKLAFNNIAKIEDLLKSNEVSNPFAIESGDTFLVPDLIMSKNNFSSIGTLSDIRTKIKKQYLDKTKAPNGAGINAAMQSFKEREKTALPPNFAKEGDKEMLVKDGVIIFGPNVTRKKYKNEDLLSTESYLIKVKENTKNIKIGTKTYKK